MAGRKISWAEPNETTIMQTEISVCDTRGGSYSVSSTIDATSDGNAKTSSNTWVTSYDDATGLRTSWYKLRHTDNTYYSDYSEAFTSQSLIKLCYVSEIKKVLSTVGRWTDSEVFDTITVVEEDIYDEFGTPLMASWSEIGKIDNDVQERYYVGEEQIYRVDRVFYGTTTKTELLMDDGFKTNNRYGMVEILPVGSSGITPDVDCDIEVHYTPRIFNKLAMWRTVVRLLELTDLTSSGTASKELAVAERELNKVEQVLANRYVVQASSRAKNYDSKYGVNRHHIVQNHDRNKYLAATSGLGW